MILAANDSPMLVLLLNCLLAHRVTWDWPPAVTGSGVSTAAELVLQHLLPYTHGA